MDSAVSLILLQKQGYLVEGLFMRNWDSSINNDYLGNPNLNNNICPQEQDYNDAKEVCDKLGIKLHRVDFIKEYWDNVFTYFLEELKKGRTPNPDIMCNKYIKFDLFKKEALRLGADFIATGHYAKIEDGYLKCCKDTNKDQTYFLAFLSSEQLESVLFPLGDITKDEVRKIALESGLKVAKKKDSTGICFIGERNFKNFLQNYLPAQQGDVVDIDTLKKIGTHNGLMYYTIGQRRGLDIGGYHDKMFVVGKNLEKNILYVCLKEDNKYLYSNSCIIEDVNFNSALRPTQAQAKFRYRQKNQDIKITYLSNGDLLVEYNKVKAVTPGQACVFYKDDICFGGGIIKEVRMDNKKLWYLL